MSEIAEIIRLQGVLILRGAAAPADGEVLNGLQVQSGAGNSGRLGADTRDDLVGAKLPLAERFELGEQACGAAATAPPVKEITDVNGRVLRDNVGKNAHLFRHSGKGQILIA